ncbi:MAG: hypothetical protein IKU08_05850 [Clostridia bacterium]|nr:hypothetical protein [Clostridia bacterium]
MRKRRPVMILLCIQLVFTLILASSGTTKNIIIRNFGTEYLFDVDYLDCYGDFNGEVELRCGLREDYPEGSKGTYGIIKTDENGLSYLSETTYDKPSDKNYVKSKGDYTFYFDPPVKVIDSRHFEMAQTANPPLFDSELTASDEYKITVSVYVLFGQISLNEIFVDGVELSQFLVTLKEAQI